MAIRKKDERNGYPPNMLEEERNGNEDKEPVH